MSTWHIAPCGREGGEGRKWTSYDGQYEREAPPERSTLFRLHVYKGCWSAFISLLKYFEPNTPYDCLNLIYETYLRGAPFSIILEGIRIERGTFSVKKCIKMGEGLAKPPQIKPCWVAPPHLPQGGTMLIFLLPGQGHVMTDSGRVPLKQIYVFFVGGGGGGVVERLFPRPYSMHV